jgi:hypothetical protein
MNAVMNEDQMPVSAALERLIARHGVMPVLKALSVRMVRRGERARVQALPLSNHLRRDIGLDPLPDDRRW